MGHAYSLLSPWEGKFKQGNHQSHPVWSTWVHNWLCLQGASKVCLGSGWVLPPLPDWGTPYVAVLDPRVSIGQVPGPPQPSRTVGKS